MQKQNNTPGIRFWKMLEILIEPPPEITDVQQKRQARLLAALLLIIILLGSISGTVQILTVPGFLSTFVAIGIAIITLSLAYALTRTKNYLLAATIAAFTPAIASYTSLLANPRDQSAFVFMLISVLLGSILLNQRFTIGIASINLLALLLLPIFQPAWTTSSITGPISYHIIIPALIVIAMWHRDLVERDRQKELFESELKFRSIFDNSVDAIGVSKTGIHVMMNRAYLKMFGYESADQLVGKPVLELIAPSQRLQILDYIRRRAAGESLPNNYETRGLRRDGIEFDMEVHVSTYELDGELYTVPILRDITERKQIMEQVQYQANVFKNVSDAIIASDLNFQIVSWNQAAEALYGWQSDEVTGKPVSDVLQTEYPVESAEQVRQQFLEQGSWKGEVIQKHKNGTRLDILTSVSSIMDESGRSTGAVAVNRDITQRKQVEAALRTNEKAYANLLKNIAGAVYRSRNDQDWTVEYISEGCMALTGFRPEELIESRVTSLGALMHPADASPVWEKCQFNLAARLACSNEYRIYHRNGEVRWVWDQVQGVYSETGELIYIEGLLTDITERKRIEEKLRLSEERYRTLAQNLPNSALLLFDQDLRFMIADGPEIEATGFSRRMLEGKTLQEALPAEFVQAVEPNMRRTLAGEAFYAEIPYQERSYRYSYVPLRDSSGKVVLAMILATNITQLKKTENALKDSQRRLSTALRATKVGAWEWDMRTNEAYWSDENYRVMGLEPHSIESKYENWAKCIHPEDQLVADAKVTEAVNNKSDLNIEFRVVWPDGSVHWINDIGSMLVDEAGKPLGMYGIQMDITERKQIQQELEANRQRLTFLLSKSPTIIYSAKISGDYAATFISENIMQQLGYRPEEFIENPGLWAENIHPADLPRINSEVEHLLEVGSHSYEYRSRHKNGQYLWMRDEMTLIRDESGNPLEIIGTWIDITKRKQAEVERENLLQELTDKNTELERFTYTVSHDLKSPLVTINGFLGYLEQDAASGNIERLKKDTHRIQEAVNKMQRLLNELLELSRIGRVMNSPVRAQFHELVQEAMDVVRGQINARGVVIRVQPRLPVVYVDKPRIIEVLQNLLDNAIRYMGDQPQPQIEIGQRGEEHGKPVFYIKDNGMGVAPEYHERIFGLFNKLDAKSEGTGVGLALVKRIIEVHDGRIWIESKLGQGATFLLTLPPSPGASVQAET